MDEDKYVLGFNDGWDLADKAPEIASQISQFKDDDEYLAGLQHGINQREIDLQEERETNADVANLEQLRREAKERDTEKEF